ncbi:transposase [Clostridium sp. CF012]|uniref:transposase n=1 Tax=Clostridium sp. CF012 TaxID=2843319 RepID=UPI001C0BE960|nr:transposase [Clostridium sp. CF012]MBU3145993.1 transposase [Clostridium sp. CF012]
MCKSRWEEVKDKLLLIEAWCRDGLIEEQIAKNLGIGVSTLSKYKVEHVELVEALKDGKEVADIEVENALKKRATGYSYIEYKTTTNAAGISTTTEVTKEVAADPTSMIFWLKNRKPKEWRDRKDIDSNINVTGETSTKYDLSGFTTEELKEMLRA